MHVSDCSLLICAIPNAMWEQMWEQEGSLGRFKCLGP
jgi:hypothetical protein